MDSVSSGNKRPEIEQIITAVNNFYNTDIRVRSRKQEIATRRAMAIYIASKHGHSSPNIGKAFNRDHTSCLAAVKKINNILDRKAVNVNLTPFVDPYMLKILFSFREDSMKKE